MNESTTANDAQLNQLRTDGPAAADAIAPRRTDGGSTPRVLPEDALILWNRHLGAREG